MAFKRVANKDAQSYIRRRIAFNGSNLYGRKFSTESGTELYVVFSYGEHFPIYIYEQGRWYKNVDKYSVSTSKHQTQANPIADNMLGMSTGAMRRLAVSGIAGLAACGEMQDY